MDMKDSCHHSAPGAGHNEWRSRAMRSKYEMAPRFAVPRFAALLALPLALTLATTPVAAQAQGQSGAESPADPAAQNPPLEIGAVAPAFALPAPTRSGTLDDPVRLSYFAGKTVVLAFFFRARTPG